MDLSMSLIHLFILVFTVVYILLITAQLYLSCAALLASVIIDTSD
jgi:hypothetical protein